MTEYYFVATEFRAKANRVYVLDREFDVVTELSKLVLQKGIPYVATENSRT